MLPLPGAPSSSWAMYRARLKAAFDGADARVCLAFWLFGLINNVLYVVILSAALDLVGPNVPKGVVLLADVIPSFLTKLCAPYFIHVLPYPVRIVLFVILSMSGMLLIALTPANTDAGNISTKMAGVVLASLSSGGGELSFLGLTHFYGPFSLAAWGSGTGAAGLIGAGAYAVATTSLGLSVKHSLLTSSLLPLIMLLSFFVVLPRGPLKHAGRRLRFGQHVSKADDETSDHDDDDDDDPVARNSEYENLIESPVQPRTLFKSSSDVKDNNTWARFKANLNRSSRLFFPYMLPLLLVYIAEYTINQGVAPTLLFPLPQTPFKHYRAFYPTYNAIYQVGVFISRSSTPFFRVHNLYAPSFLQMLNLALLTLHALFNFIPHIYIIFAIVFWEGLLGGLVYVNTFAEITDKVPREDREFSLGATSVSDSGGICVAGFIGMTLEVFLCRWQTKHGRDLCTKLWLVKPPTDRNLESTPFSLSESLDVTINSAPALPHGKALGVIIHEDLVEECGCERTVTQDITVMARVIATDYFGDLRRTAQRNLGLALNRIQTNWGLDALSAIPDVDGLRPVSVDALSTEVFRFLAYLSSREKDVEVFRVAILEQRKRRLEAKKFVREKDKLIAVTDVRKIYDRYRTGLVSPSRGHGGVPFEGNKSADLHRETSQLQVQDGGREESILSNLDSDDFRSFESSSSGSNTTLHSSINVTQPEVSIDATNKLKRRKLADEEEPSRLTKRRKHSNSLVTDRGQFTAVELRDALWVAAPSPSLGSVSSDQGPFSTAVKNELSEDGVEAEELSTVKSSPGKIAHLEAHPTRELSQSDRRSPPYHRSPSTPSVSPLSAGPTEQPARKSPRTRHDPLNNMLDKITTDFTDNLFFLHGVLRTYADSDTARARANALDAAAADVLESMDTFRRRVELIDEEVIEPSPLAPLPSTPAVPGIALDSDYRSLPDYCPPTSTLPKNNPQALKADWTGKPSDLSNDPDIHLLHEAEVQLASTLRLTGATYLCSKRRIFEARLQALRIGKEFQKMDAQRVCKIDVHKASKLWMSYERVGWFKRELFEQYLGVLSATLSDQERQEAAINKDGIELRPEHMPQFGGSSEHVSQRLRSPREQDIGSAMLQDFPDQRPVTSCQTPDSEETGTVLLQKPTTPAGVYKDPFEELFINPWSTETG